MRLGLARRPVGAAGGGRVQLRGRVDRLERDQKGRLVVVNLKTGANAPGSVDDAAEHPQLAAYQVAAALGAFGTAASSAERHRAGRGWSTSPTRRADGQAKEPAQPPLDPEGVAHWQQVLQRPARPTRPERCSWPGSGPTATGPRPAPPPRRTGRAWRCSAA